MGYIQNLTPNQDLSQASGTIGYGFLSYIYEGFMDSALNGCGRSITLHLEPSIQQNESVKSNPIKPGSYNPFFGTSIRPSDDGQSRGVKVTNRDVSYTAHIRHGPVEPENAGGIGELKRDEVRTTTVFESLDHLKDCVSATIDGQRFIKLKGYKVIGFSDKKYIIQDWQALQEAEK